MFEKYKLSKVEEPYLIPIKINKNDFENLLNSYSLNTEKNCVVTLLCGSKMRTIDSLFNEFASGLQFPSYFGKNWSAFDECINDLDWLSGESYIIGITDSNDLLCRDEEEISTFFKILKKACEEWSKPKDIGQKWGREGRPFHILFQYDQERDEFVRSRFGKYLNFDD